MGSLTQRAVLLQFLFDVITRFLYWYCCEQGDDIERHITSSLAISVPAISLANSLLFSTARRSYSLVKRNVSKEVVTIGLNGLSGF